VAAGGMFRQVAADLQRFSREWPPQGAAVLEREATQRVRAATGGDGRLSHARGRGPATVRVKKAAGTAEVAADGDRGVWAILEYGTSTHVVRAKPGKLLRTPYGARRQVTVSGVRAKRPWDTAMASGEPKVMRDAERRFAQIVGG
jgi:hypothetical protein